MVIYPALALLIGAFVVGVRPGERKRFVWAGAALYGLIGICAGAGLVYVANIYSTSELSFWHYLAALIVAGIALYAAYLAVRGRYPQGLTVAVLGGGVLAWITFEGILPTLDKLALTPRLSDMLDRYEAHPLDDDTGPVALVGYHEPSAVFTLGTDTQLLNAEAAAAWIAAAPRRAVVVEDRSLERFLVALPDGAEPEAVASITGFNYSNNKDMRLTLFRLVNP